MAVVLVERVLEGLFGAVEALGPLRSVGSAEDPASDVFRFNDEDAVAGDEEVIDLGGAIVGGNDDVVKAPVDGGPEKEPKAETHLHLADPAEVACGRRGSGVSRLRHGGAGGVAPGWTFLPKEGLQAFQHRDKNEPGEDAAEVGCSDEAHKLGS